MNVFIVSVVDVGLGNIEVIGLLHEKGNILDTELNYNESVMGVMMFQNKDKWTVITYTDKYYKIFHDVGNYEDAGEYATRILQLGDNFKDDRGIITFIPVNHILKVKVVPPDVELGFTKTWTKFTGS